MQKGIEEIYSLRKSWPTSIVNLTGSCANRCTKSLDDDDEELSCFWGGISPVQLAVESRNSQHVQLLLSGKASTY